MDTNFKRVDLKENGYKIKVNNLEWEEILIDKENNLYTKVVEEIFDDNSLFYYTSARPETRTYIENLSNRQKRKAKQFLSGLLKDPENFSVDNNNYYEVLNFINEIEEENSSEEDKRKKLILFVDKYELSLDEKFDYVKIKNSILKQMAKESRNGIFGEILFYKTVDFLIDNSNLLFSKLPAITAAGTYAHGADGIFIHIVEGKIVYCFGEAKFCNDIEGAIKQIKQSISNFKNLGNDKSFMERNLMSMKYFSSDLEEELIAHNIEENIDDFADNNIEVKKEIYVFMLYGGDFYLKEKIEEKLSDSDINVEGFDIKIICFPIIDKRELVKKIMEKVSELEEQNE